MFHSKNFIWTCTWVNLRQRKNKNRVPPLYLWFFRCIPTEMVMDKQKTVRTLPRLLHVDRLSSLSHCRDPRGPPKRSLCRLHRQLRTGRLIIVTSFYPGADSALRGPNFSNLFHLTSVGFKKEKKKKSQFLYRFEDLNAGSIPLCC